MSDVTSHVLRRQAAFIGFNRKVRSTAEPHLVVNFNSRSDIQLHLISTFFAQKDESKYQPSLSAGDGRSVVCMRPAQEQHTDVAISDSSEKTITKKIDFFMNSLQQEADRIGLVKEYAQSVKDATLLASARLEDLEARKSKAARQTKLSESLGISQEQYAELVEKVAIPKNCLYQCLMLTTKTAKMTTLATATATLRKGLNQSLPSHFQQSLSLLRRRSG